MLVAWAAYGLRGIVRTPRPGRDWRPALGAALLLANAAAIGLALAPSSWCRSARGSPEPVKRRAGRLSGCRRGATPVWYRTRSDRHHHGDPQLPRKPDARHDDELLGNQLHRADHLCGIVALALAIYAVALRVGRAAERRDAGVPADPLVFFSILGSVFLLLAVDARW